jgi:uncharacterized membrane protein YphA (DoxX/SURF4 family)
VPLTTTTARHRFGQTIVANLIGCALVVIGAFTTPILFGLGFLILVVSLAVHLYVLATAKRAGR